MRFLIDTCVISEARRKSLPAVRWLNSASLDANFRRVMTIAEVVRSIADLNRRCDTVGAKRLQSWLTAVRRDYHGRILPVTDPVATQWGELRSGRSRPLVDALIAATALVHGLAVVTRNVADFADTGVAVVNS